MRNTILLRVFAAELFLLSFAVPATAATKVFLLAGQSNMQGMGGYTGWVSGYPADSPCPAPYNAIQTSVRFWDYGTPTADTQYPGGPANRPELAGTNWVDLDDTYGYKAGDFGPEVSFGYRLQQLYPNDQIYLVKYARGSTDLAVQWNPDGGISTDPTAAGGSYNWFKARVNAALTKLSIDGLDPTIAGMIWMQGEGDAKSTTYSNAYQTNLTNFIASVRSQSFSTFANPNMPFVIGRLDDYYLGRPGGATVRTAQQYVGENVPGVSWFSTDDLQNAYVGHFGTQGQIDLGLRFADQFIAVPEPSTSVLTGTALLAFLGAWRRRRRSA